MSKHKHFQRVWPLYAIFGTAIITLICARAFIEEPKFDWPTWIQAVGSVAAILVAVWVPYLQRIDAAAADLAKEREEARRICLAIRDELRMVLKAFAEGSNVQTLLNLAEGSIFNIAVANIEPAERFPIYRSVVGRLTLIDDDELRHDIIWSYELAIALMHMGIQNNRMLFELRDLNRDTAANEFEFQYQCLQESAMNMQKICKQTIDRVTRLVASLDQITALP